VSHPRWIAAKVHVTDKPWTVCELTKVEGAFDYHEVAAFASLREASADIESRRLHARTERTQEWRARSRRRATRRGR
jgi:hypothetical protein